MIFRYTQHLRGQTDKCQDSISDSQWQDVWVFLTFHYKFWCGSGSKHGRSSGSSVANMSTPAKRHVCLPVNSTCITAGQLCRLGLALGISVMSSINDQRLMVEATTPVMFRWYSWSTRVKPCLCCGMKKESSWLSQWRNPRLKPQLKSINMRVAIWVRYRQTVADYICRLEKAFRTAIQQW